MRLKRVATATLGVLGAAAVGNRAVSATAGDLDPALDGEQATFRWRGIDVGYVEGGDPDDPDLLLLHGVHAAASNEEFARVFGHLTDEFHVIAPDLPGFGTSDRPPLVYSASLYESFVTDFAAKLTDDAVCVASSLSGAYAAAAQREAAPFSLLVLVAPVADTGPRRAWVRTLFRAPLVGTTLFNLLTSKPSLRYFGRREAVADAEALADEDVGRFWRTAHQPGARFAPASFVGGFLDPEMDLAEALADVSVPITLVWGREASFPPLEWGRALAERADARLVVFDGAKLLPHHEHPGAFLDALTEELSAPA
jgi:pimeloyl-ACP methyl ester carboxylesterase